MPISDFKITAEDIAKYGCVNLPDRLTGDAQENKMKFDRLVRECVAGAVNAVIDHMQVVEDESIDWSEAEQDRVVAEAAREAAEGLRVSAEASRQAAEQERAGNEQAREQAEVLRASAETARALAEQARASAESGRESAEAARDSAEKAREAAEAGREAAEQEREREREAFAVFEDYDPAKTYVPGNKVYFEGSSYINRVSCTGISPADTARWQMIARRGASGDGTGDMLKSEYDPQNRNSDIWAVRQIADGGTGAGTVQGALAKLHAKPGENLLINAGDFRRPVNRKGKQTYTEYGVCIDGWIVNNLEKVSCVDGITLSSAGISFGIPNIEQRLEVDTIPINAEVTVSALTKDWRLLCASGILGDANVISSKNPNDNEYVRINRGNKFISFNICLNAYNTSGSFVAARCEIGSEQHLAYQDENGAWQLLEEPDYDAEYLKCCMYSLENGAFIGLPYSNENLLINADCSINQRGQDGYNTGLYGYDMWKNDTNGTGTVRRIGDIVEISSDGGLFAQSQFIENPGNYVGKTITASILVAEISGTMHLAIAGMTAVWERADISSPGLYSFSVAGRVDGGILSYSCRVPAGSNVKIKGRKLEYGSVQTLARQDAAGNWVLIDPPPDKGVELVKCQRYFCNSGDGEKIRIAQRYSPDHRVWATIPIPVTMRVTPTVVSIGATELYSLDASISYPITSYGVEALGGSGVVIWFQSDAITDAFDGFVLAKNIQFDANL